MMFQNGKNISGCCFMKKHRMVKYKRWYKPLGMSLCLGRFPVGPPGAKVSRLGWLRSFYVASLLETDVCQPSLTRQKPRQALYLGHRFDF